jgi:hypothetical protein
LKGFDLEGREGELKLPCRHRSSGSIGVWARTQEAAANKVREQKGSKVVVTEVKTAKYPKHPGSMKYHTVHLKPRERR